LLFFYALLFPCPDLYFAPPFFLQCIGNSTSNVRIWEED
jgi:hypothetical protein